MKRYLGNFLKSISYVGFTENINMMTITQVLRRIYKEPETMETEELLNYLVTMAIGQARYSDYDVKSKQFVEKAIALVEKQFTGTRQITVNHNDKQFDLYTFNQIRSPQKAYNKILDRNQPVDELDSMFDDNRDFFKSSVFGDEDLMPRRARWASANEEQESF